ncbi:phosphoglycerate mutase family protein [soil metagenome]
MKWANYIIAGYFIGMYLPVNAQQENLFEGSTFYLVRHAEKDTGNNPPLKKIGYCRAGDLYRVLKNKKISKIYVSQYRCTELTADSLRIYSKVNVIKYKADEKGDDLFYNMGLQSRREKAILIVGHSNTIPAIIRRFGVKDFNLVEIPDHEYDNLYIVKVGRYTASLKVIKYGKASAPGSKEMMKPLQ